MDGRIRRILRDVGMTDRDADGIPRAQLARMTKIASEPFFLVAHPEATELGALTFVVSGSTQTRHTVTLTREGRVFCSCMDARVRCRQCGCICKHACFVLVRVMRLPSVAVYTRLRLSEADLRTCAEVVAGRTALHDAVFRPMVTPGGPPASGGHHRPGAVFTAFRPPRDEDECPICYTPLLHPDAEANPLRGCPDCSQAVHRDCMRRWVVYSPSRADNTCVMCRSPVWSAWDGG